MAIHRKWSLETVMFRDITGLLEMAVCCAKPPYATAQRAKKHHVNGAKELASWAVLEGSAELAGNYFVPDKCGCQ